MKNYGVIIVGSTSESSRLHGMAKYVQKELSLQGCEIDYLDVLSLPADDLLRLRFDSEPIKYFLQQIEGARFCVICTPVYKAAYAGILKCFLDMLPQKSMEDKLVLPLMMGGTSAHLLSIEYSLKPVLSALGCRHILQGVYATDAQIKREDGGFGLEEGLKERLKAGVADIMKSIVS